MASGKFIGYYRVSTKGQGLSGLGLESQRQAVAVHLNGGPWALIGEYMDIETGTRKGNGKRPGLESAIARCRQEKATLVIAKLDRLARNVAFVSMLMESSVEFVAADMPFANRLTIHILAAVAEHEAEMISERTKAALAAARARGVSLGNPNLDVARVKSAASNRALAVEAYAGVTERAMSLKAEGKSLRAVAQRLTAEGHRTRQGANFTSATVQRMLRRISTDIS